MRAYGDKRTYHGCRVRRAGWGRKILFRCGVKSRKLGRRWVDERECG